MPEKDLIKKFAPRKRPPRNRTKKQPVHPLIAGVKMYLPAIVFVVVAVSVAFFVLGSTAPASDDSDTDVIEEAAPLVNEPSNETEAFITAEEPLVEEPVDEYITTTVAVILDTPTGFLNMRSGPGISFARVDQVHPGDEFVVLEESNGWLKLERINAEDAWVIDMYASVGERLLIDGELPEELPDSSGE